MKKFSMNWSLWREGLAFIIAVILIFKFVQNIEPIVEGVQRFLNIITPFIIGTVLAYFLSRPCRKVEERLKKTRLPFLVKRARGFSVLTVFLMVVAIIGLILSYVVPIITANLFDFGNQFVTHYFALMRFVNELGTQNWVTALNLNEILLSLTDMFSIPQLAIQVGNSLTSLASYILTMTSGIVTVFLSVIICLYMLVYTDTVLAMVDRIARAFIKDSALQATKSYIKKLNEIFFQFVSCQFLDACILGTLATILLAVLGVEYAVTLGLLLGICNMIPYFGSIFASVVTAIITIFTGGFQLALITAICLLILQQIDGNFIGPRLMGDALDLNPMLIILSITVGGAYFGIVGMFVSVPVAAMLKMILNDFLEMRERKLHVKPQ